MGYAAFPREILRPPRSLAAQTYTDIRRWSQMEKGGHFAALSRKALEIDPNDVRTLSALGVQLLRTGDETEAREVLEKSFAIDKFDQTTFNLLTMLDSLDKFDTTTDGDIVFKSHPSETPVMREYVAPLAQQALAVFSEKYQFTPKGPILIEMFPKHDDFAVRTVGLPGMIGALGACFGRVVTLDSPKARPPGDFNWAPTLWHELAHVMTLQLSKQRVPRWLTEGISTYEEKLGSPAWGREGELSFVAAYGVGEHMTVRELNAAFQDPEKISLAYYQASILTEHIVGKYGMSALRKLLVSYGEGLEGEAALKAGLGVDIDTLQADLDKLLASKYGSIVRALKPPKELEPGKGDPEAIAAAFPDSFQAQVALGEYLRKAGRIDEAFKVLERAAEMVPMATGPRSPRSLMAHMALERKDSARAISELEKLLEHANTDLESVRLLARELEANKSPSGKLMSAYERLAQLDPFDAANHSKLGRLKMQAGDARTAVREFRAAIAAGSLDPAAAHSDLAESYLAVGDKVQARRAVLAAIEVAPGYPRAQELLLKVVGQ
jgi:Flp pilus assembly protein TadD